jgi:hypothetical protein
VLSHFGFEEQGGLQKQYEGLEQAFIASYKAHLLGGLSPLLVCSDLLYSFWLTFA